MSEVLQKYRDKVEYLEKFSKSYQDLVSSALNNLKRHAKGDADLVKALDDMQLRVKAAENIFQVEQMRKEFLGLIKQVNAHMDKGVSNKGGILSNLGSMFGGGVVSEKKIRTVGTSGSNQTDIDLVDSTRELLLPYFILLEGFSKGTMTLSDEKAPFYEPLKLLREKTFDGLTENDANSLSSTLFNFFINKSNESSVVEHEREELKKIIGSLTGYIQSLSVSTKTFGSKLDMHSKKIAAATSLDEIKKIQRAILVETLEIQKVNGAVTKRLSEAEQKLEVARDEIVRLEQNLESAQKEKSIDALTKIYNRGYFDEMMDRTFELHKRHKEPHSLILLDIDKFKDFNDTYGHQVGDQVLKIVAEIIKKSVRASDLVARYGGEEFAIILSKTTAKKCMKVAETVRKNVGSHEFGIRGKTIHVTISLGVTEFADSDNDVNTIVERADKGLYAAKEQGRDRTVQNTI